MIEISKEKKADLPWLKHGLHKSKCSMGQLVNQSKIFVLIRLKSNILQDVCVGGTEMFEKIASPE